MRPSFSGNNSSYGWGRNSKYFTQTYMGKIASCVFGSDFQHISLRKFTGISILPSGANPSSLRVHFVHVLLLIPQMKMIRIAATPGCYAVMKNMQTIWNIGSTGNNPRNSVCAEVKSLSVMYKEKLAVAILGAACLPQPAIVASKNSNVGPKSCLAFVREKLLQYFRWDRFCSHSVSLVDLFATPSVASMTRGQPISS